MAAYSLSDFSPDQSIGYLAKRVTQDARALIEPSFADAEVTYTEWSALVSIYFGKGATCAAMARDIGHDVGASSRMLSSLEERGLIVRERSGDDRRVVHLSLTQRGDEIAHRYKARLVEQWNQWLTDWSSDDLATLIGLMQRLRSTLDAARGGAA